MLLEYGGMLELTRLRTYFFAARLVGHVVDRIDRRTVHYYDGEGGGVHAKKVRGGHYIISRGGRGT